MNGELTLKQIQDECNRCKTETARRITAFGQCCLCDPAIKRACSIIDGTGIQWQPCDWKIDEQPEDEQ